MGKASSLLLSPSAGRRGSSWRKGPSPQRKTSGKAVQAHLYLPRPLSEEISSAQGRGLFSERVLGPCGAGNPNHRPEHPHLASPSFTSSRGSRPYLATPTPVVATSAVAGRTGPKQEDFLAEPGVQPE